MKKLLFVFAIAAFAACGSGSGTGSTSDTTKVDSPAVVAPDTTHHDTMVAPVDTTKKDTTKK